ncbi:MAG: molybdopterin dinucleotide binding domain-containing protein, partial [Hoeflea sp.]|nr:molybdopterin dinucleotide binding domain-containing protein [Hoeflea sp.]
ENGIRFHPMVVRSIASYPLKGEKAKSETHTFDLAAVASGLEKHLADFEKHDERHNKDGKFRFRPDWTGTPAANRPPKRMGPQGPVDLLPEFPDHVELIESADADHPFRLATSPSRSFLNSSFAETPSSQAKEVRPDLMIHPNDAHALGIAEGDRVRLGNPRGEVSMHAKLDAGQRRGVVIHEGLWPNSAFEDGEGINTLTGADSCAPYGGAAFHDTRVWVRKI